MKLKTLLFGSLLAAGTTFVVGANADAAETYTVENGDTLSTISQKFVGDNSLVQKIAADNQLANVDLIFAGQQLTINADGSVVAAPVEQAQEKTYQAEAAPVQEAAPVAETAPVQEAAVVEAAPVQETVATETAAPATTNSAKEWIAQKESSGSYTATNGKYIGRYQLDSSYLNGDYSAENQERVAEQYVTSRYGSWEGAQSFWQANGWY